MRGQTQILYQMTYSKPLMFMLLHLAVVIAFAAGYLAMSRHSPSDDDKLYFSHYVDAFYYTLITHFSLGFGDYNVKSWKLRGVTLAHIMCTFILLRFELWTAAGQTTAK